MGNTLAAYILREWYTIEKETMMQKRGQLSEHPSGWGRDKARKESDRRDKARIFGVIEEASSSRRWEGWNIEKEEKRRVCLPKQEETGADGTKCEIIISESEKWIL